MTLRFLTYRRLKDTVKATYIDHANAEKAEQELGRGVLYRDPSTPKGGRVKQMRVCTDEGWVTVPLPFYLAENAAGHFYPIAVDIFVLTFDRTPLEGP